MSDIPVLTEVNCLTGEVIIRPLTEEEIVQAAADKVSREAAAATAAAAAEAASAAAAELEEKRASAINKLRDLGLTDDEIFAIIS